MEQEGTISNTQESKFSKNFNWQNLFIGIFVCVVLLGAYQAIFKDRREVRLFANSDIAESRGNFNQAGTAVGLHTTYYEDGVKHYEVEYSEFGKRNGVYKVWSEKGKLLISKNYSNGKINGESKRWDENGKLIEHEIYENDTLIQKIK